MNLIIKKLKLIKNKINIQRSMSFLLDKRSLYYLMVGASSMVFLTSGYYIFDYFFGEEESEEEKENEIIKRINMELLLSHGTLNPILAVIISSYINQLYEKLEESNLSSLNEERRKYLNDRKKYEELAQDYLNKQNVLYSTSIKTVLDKLNNKINYQQIEQELSKLSNNEIEKLFFEYDKPLFNKNIPEKNIAKDAYLFYGNKLKDEMKNFQEEIVKIKDLNENNIHFRLQLIKLLVNDYLFNKYNLTERQLTFCVFEYKLLEDSEVLKVHDEINKLDSMFTQNM